MNEASERDKLRGKMMNAMSPLCNEHSRWYGWPGTWAFAEAALSVLDAERAAVPVVQPTMEAQVPSYVQPVPDHCDRIVWRNHYYPLPLAAAPQARQEQPDSVHLTEPKGEAATARDAARYRWLRDEANGDSFACPALAGEALDEAIDAALSSTPAQGDGGTGGGPASSEPEPKGGA